jgi:hypothetical protein
VITQLVFTTSFEDHLQIFDPKNAPQNNDNERKGSQRLMYSANGRLILYRSSFIDGLGVVIDNSEGARSKKQGMRGAMYNFDVCGCESVSRPIRLQKTARSRVRENRNPNLSQLRQNKLSHRTKHTERNDQKKNA